MGTWGHLAFENDDALMWVDEFVSKRRPLPFAQKTLKVITPDVGAIEACREIAAAELVCKLTGKKGRSLPNELEMWLEESKSTSTPGLVELAAIAVDLIRKKSELRELWKGER